MRQLLLPASLIIGLPACQLLPHDPGASPPADADIGDSFSPASDPAFLLTARGGYVVSDPPPGMVVRLGSKEVRRAGWRD